MKIEDTVIPGAGLFFAVMIHCSHDPIFPVPSMSLQMNAGILGGVCGGLAGLSLALDVYANQVIILEGSSAGCSGQTAPR